MNCADHPETPAAAFCRECGKPMCVACQRPALGTVYCQEHLPVYAAPPPPPYTAPASPYNAPHPAAVPNPDVHPSLALILGFAPGVGAIYNGQYAKGLIHAVVFGLLITMITSARSEGLQAMLGIMIGVWVIYQAFEAFHTARQRRYGLRVEEFSSLFETRQSHGRFPSSAILLIGLGFILLLNTTDIIRMEQLERYWPLLLIGAGVYLLYVRLNPADRDRSRTVDNSGSLNGGAPQ
ncbi:MAG: B-box zinc finger protein [Terriglobia bacterium]